MVVNQFGFVTLFEFCGDSYYDLVLHIFESTLFSFSCSIVKISIVLTSSE